MHDMVTRHTVQTLRNADHAVDDVGHRAGVSASTVKRIAKEAPVESFDDVAERKRRRIGRPSKVVAWRSVIEGLVKERDSTGRPLQSKEVVRRLRAKGYKGGKSAAYTLISSLRDDDVDVVTRFEGLPGEFCQHDFGQVMVRFANGSTSRVRFFASRLKYSRFVAVSLVDDETAETISRCLVEHYGRFGGVPLVGVFDRPSTIALKWTSDCVVTRWNAMTAGTMLELGVAIEVCWPRRGNQKGSIENLVGFVKGSFFKQRVFNDDADLREQLTEWQREVNEDRPCRATDVTPRARMADETPRLRPVKLSPTTFAVKLPVVVRPGAVVVHEGHSYQLPPSALGRTGTLHLLKDRVRIIVGAVDIVYRRPARGGPPQKLTSPQLKMALVDVAKGPRGKLYLKRQQLLELGQHAHDFLTELVHRKPRTWKPDVERLHELALQHDDTDMRAAFRKALDGGAIGSEYVAHWLKDGEHARTATLRPSLAAVPVVVAHESGAQRSHGDDDGDGGPSGSIVPRVRAPRSQRGGAR
jgi:transposase